jgi:hypothetical protein
MVNRSAGHVAAIDQGITSASRLNIDRDEHLRRSAQIKHRQSLRAWDGRTRRVGDPE